MFLYIRMLEADAAILTGGTAGFLFEHAAEIIYVGKADLRGDGCEAVACASDEFFGVIDAQGVDILHRGDPIHLVEQAAKVGFAHIDRACDLGDAQQFVREMLRDVHNGVFQEPAFAERYIGRAVQAQELGIDRIQYGHAVLGGTGLLQDPVLPHSAKQTFYMFLILRGERVTLQGCSAWHYKRKIRANIPIVGSHLLHCIKASRGQKQYVSRFGDKFAVVKAVTHAAFHNIDKRIRLSAELFFRVGDIGNDAFADIIEIQYSGTQLGKFYDTFFAHYNLQSVVISQACIIIKSKNIKKVKFSRIIIEVQSRKIQTVAKHAFTMRPYCCTLKLPKQEKEIDRI